VDLENVCFLVVMCYAQTDGTVIFASVTAHNSHQAGTQRLVKKSFIGEHWWWKIT